MDSDKTKLDTLKMVIQYGIWIVALLLAGGLLYVLGEINRIGKVADKSDRNAQSNKRNWEKYGELDKRTDIDHAKTDAELSKILKSIDVLEADINRHDSDINRLEGLHIHERK